MPDLTPEQTNDTVALFSQLKDGARDAQPDLGFGSAGERPPEGDHECVILDVNYSAAKFKRKDTLEIPATRVRFDYQLLNDPERPNNPLKWKGESMLLVTPTQLVDEKDQTRCRIAFDRFAGFVYTLLGRTPTPATLVADAVELKKMLMGTQQVIALIHCRYRKDTRTAAPGAVARVYFEEFCRKKISG